MAAEGLVARDILATAIGCIRAYYVKIENTDLDCRRQHKQAERGAAWLAKDGNREKVNRNKRAWRLRQRAVIAAAAAVATATATATC
jgi:hypothetical protein